MKEITQFANGISKFSRLRRLVLFLSSKYCLKHDISRGGGFRPQGENFLGVFFARRAKKFWGVFRRRRNFLSFPPIIFFPPHNPDPWGGKTFFPPIIPTPGGEVKKPLPPHMAQNETPPPILGVLSWVHDHIRNHGFRKILVLGTLKINIFTFLKSVSTRCFLQNESKKINKIQKIRFLCPKRFLVFSVQGVLYEIKKLENATYA